MAADKKKPNVEAATPKTESDYEEFDRDEMDRIIKQRGGKR